MAYGMTSAGFVRKTLDVSREELEAALKVAFGEDIPLVDSVFAVLVGIVAEREAEIWELMEGVYNSQYPDTADGAAFRNSIGLTGHYALGAEKSTLEAVALTGDVGTVIPAGSRASVPATGAQFETLEEVTLTGSGDTVDMQAVEYGPVEAPSGTLTQIDTPISGWDAISNPTDAVLGRNDETDAEARARRELDMTVSKASAEGAIRRAILAVTGVTDCSVTMNVLDVADDAGRPPHSFEAVVVGGADADIRSAIWAVKPAGIQTYGSVSGYVEDSDGNAQVVKFSRGSTVRVYVSVSLVRNSLYPVDGDAAIKALIAAYGQTLRAGDRVVNFKLVDAVSEDAELLKGIDTIDVYQARTASPSTKTSLSMDPDEIAMISEDDIVVT